MGHVLESGLMNAFSLMRRKNEVFPTPATPRRITLYSGRMAGCWLACHTDRWYASPSLALRNDIATRTRKRATPTPIELAQHFLYYLLTGLAS